MPIQQKIFAVRISHVIVPIIIAITALVIYSNTFSVPFLFDDFPNITQNNKIRFLSNYLNLSGTRYIGELSFALNYYFGELEVFGYHLVNIIIHILNGILVWWLVNLIFKTPVMRRAVISPQTGSVIAITASLIFVSHPIQTQAVTYIVQRLASLATLFYLLSVVLFLKWRLSPGFGYRVVLYLLSLLSVVLAMKTKEMSFTIPFIIILCEFAFFRDRLKRVYLLIPYILTILIIPLTIMSIGSDKPLGDIVGDLSEASRDTEGISRGDYLLTQFRVIVTYIRLLFLPVNQNLDYDYPVYHSLFIPVVFLSFLFLLFIIGVGVYLLIRSVRSGNCYALFASFGIFWFFITLSIESSIIPIKDVIFEHRLYLPAVGAVMAFSSAVLYGLEHWKSRRGTDTIVTAYVFIFIIVVLLSFATYQRNWTWRDEITLWMDVVAKSPLKARGYNNLAFAYDNQGRIDKAVEEYKTAVKLKPDYVDAHNNLGLAYDKQGRIEEAMEEYKAAIRLKPDNVNAYNNLGLAYVNQGRIEEAVEEYKTAIRLKPDYLKAHNNLGIAYDKQGRVEEAVEEYKTAIRLKPDTANAYNNLGIAYDKQGRVDEAVEEYKTAIRLKPDYVKAHNNLGLAYAKQGRIDKAIEEYRIAIKIAPDYARAHNNLGLAYDKLGRIDEAIEEYKVALSLKPDYENASYNLKLAYQKKKLKNSGL